MIDPISDRVETFRKGHLLLSKAATATRTNNSSRAARRGSSTSKGTAENFFSRILKAISDFFKLIFGICPIDNTPYEKLHHKLKAREKSTSAEENYIQARAQYLFEKSSEVISHGNRQQAKRRNPWEGLSENAGICMSNKLAMLQGYDEEQIYNYNCALNFSTGAQLGIRQAGKGRIIRIADLDNTCRNKNWDPSDTWLVASNEELMWARKMFEQGEMLHVSEWVNTARAPFPTVIQLIPEGLDKYITYGVLHGPFQERFGLSTKDQLDATRRASIIFLNSGGIQHPYKKLALSAKIMREAEIFSFFEGKDGPKVNGKTFLETYLSLIKQEGFSVFEPKGLPKYLIDSHKVLGSTCLANYLKIIELKEKHVDNRQKGTSEEEAWGNFTVLYST